MAYLMKYNDEERLNRLNRNIWRSGFNVSTLTELRLLTKEIQNGTILFERIPQKQQFGLSKGSSKLASAAIICRGCPQTESEFRQIYDTDDIAGEGQIQERFVEIWARINSCWYDSPELFLSSKSQVCDAGTESQVFFDVENQVVRKLISLKHYNVLRLALDRIIIHNAVFTDSFLNVIGYGRNALGQFVIIVEQPYCQGVMVTEQERVQFMKSMGFHEAGMDYGMHLNFCTDDLYIGDLNDYNVIKGRNGIHVIDADCRINTKYIGCGGSFEIPTPDLDFTVPYFL